MEKLSINACEIIVAVLESNSFTKAGQRLNLTPSAVSHTVKKIENTLGYALFYRYKNGVFMTESGKQLIPYIKVLLEASRILDNEVTRIGNSESGIVKIGTFFSCAAYWMPGIIMAFNEIHPDITVQLFQSGDSQIIEWIRNFDVDLAILSSDTFEDDIPYTFLHRSKMMCLTPSGFTPLDGKNMTPADFENTPLILQYEGFDTEITSYLKRYDLNAPTNIWVESDHAGFSLVRAGLGCYISPQMALEEVANDFNIYPLHPETYRNIGITCVVPDRMSPATKLLHDFIVGWSGSHFHDVSI